MMSDEERVLKTMNDKQRWEMARIAAAESDYWAEVETDDRDMQNVAMGAMGAAGNICAAIAQGKTLAEVQADIANRKVRT